MRETINLKRVILTSQARKTLEAFKQINNKLYYKIKNRFCNRYLYVRTTQELHKYADIIKKKVKPRIYVFRNFKEVEVYTYRLQNR